MLTREQWLARFGNGLENRAFAVEDAQVREYGAASVAIGALARRPASRAATTPAEWAACRGHFRSG